VEDLDIRQELNHMLAKSFLQYTQLFVNQYFFSNLDEEKDADEVQLTFVIRDAINFIMEVMSITSLREDKQIAVNIQNQVPNEVGFDYQKF